MGWLTNNYTHWLGAGLLLGLATVWPVIWPLGLVGGSWFLYALFYREGSVRQQCIGAWLAWSLKAGCANVFFWSVYPIDWLPIELSGVQLLLIFIYWCTTALWLGLGAVVVVVGYRWSKRYLEGNQSTLLLAVAPLWWVLGEMMGSLLFSLMTYGAGGAITVAYSFGYAGYLLAEHELLLQVARLGGVYSLSFLFACFALGILLVWRTEARSLRIIVLCVVGAVYATSFTHFFTFQQTQTTDLITVIAVDTAFPNNLLHNSDLAQSDRPINAAVTAALAYHPDYLVLPEGAEYFAHQQSDAYNKKRYAVTETATTTIVDSGRVSVAGAQILQALVYDGARNTVEKVHKRYLVPQGEFMPYLYKSALSVIGDDAMVAYVGNYLDYEIGPATSQKLLAPTTPAILFCFESVDPSGVKRLGYEHPEAPFVAHIVSHGWFKDSAVLQRELTRMLQVQAVWGQRYIISATSHWHTQAFSPTGVIQLPTEVARGEGWVARRVELPKPE